MLLANSRSLGEAAPPLTQDALRAEGYQQRGALQAGAASARLPMDCVVALSVRATLAQTCVTHRTMHAVDGKESPYVEQRLQAPTILIQQQ